MNLIELHIIQSFPVTCLNRDDVGAPKSAEFGGCRRARVSSQCWKRAIRAQAKQELPAFFGGVRTRFVVRELDGIFREKGCSETEANALARIVADAMGKLDDPDKGNVKTLLFCSPLELQAVADAMLELEWREPIARLIEALDKSKTDPESKIAKKAVEKAEKEPGKLAKKAVAALKAKVKDMADIAIFGRMVADDHSLMLEGAGLFSHALSTHSVANEIDFFSAVDDRNMDDEGAGHIGTLEFNSACYYRYVGLNLDLLADDDHLGHFSAEERDQVTKAFLRAAILSVPGARKNSMFGFNPPAFVLGLRRTGQPLSLVNAFETPVRSSHGYINKSIEALKKHWESLKNLYSLGRDTTAENEMPPTSLDDLIDGLTAPPEA